MNLITFNKKFHRNKNVQIAFGLLNVSNFHETESIILLNFMIPDHPKTTIYIFSLTYLA